FPDWPETMGPPFTESQLYSFMMQESLGRMLYFGVVLGFVLLLTNTLAAERQGQQKLAIAHKQLRQYALRIEDQATLEERNRIAREIHDSLGHLLTAQKIQLNNALAFLPSAPANTKGRDFIQAGKQLGVEALQELRVSLKMLRSDPLKRYSLEQLLHQLIVRFNHEMGLQVQQQIQLDVPVPNEIKRALYRIVEEALNNMYKHSQAQKITLQVRTQTLNVSAEKTALNNPSTRPTELWLMITDDGQGFDMSQNTSGFGLRGMQERALALGGQLTIDTQPGAGCKISGRLPIIGMQAETMP
ncbi:MAG: sensor histidine kinase, partial [Cyanobacteria bacterium P01_F01_bin.53]